MSAKLSPVVTALNRRFLLDYPQEAAHRLESVPADDAAAALAAQPAPVLVPVFVNLTPDRAAAIFEQLPAELRKSLLEEMYPNDALRLLGQLEPERQADALTPLEPAIVAEIRRLQTYPPDSAGRLMESRISYFRDSATVEDTVDRLRRLPARDRHSLFIVDAANRLCGRVSIQDIAVAPPGTRLGEIAEPVSATVYPVAPQQEIVELLERNQLSDLAVVDSDGRLVGSIYYAALLQAVQHDATADIQTMVGASADEKALSKPMFAVRKRLPWMQINLLTAFLAAAVVGLFEATIASYTALAVLLPVVAGQSGNAGAQALAVTMRGLALREIGLQHWLSVTLKEVQVGFINGVAVALTCGIGVYLWSGSIGLVIVIALAMVLAMVAAGFAGAIVPIMLTRIGQDPAQSSSIILTTVTDVAGFFAFLGIATLLVSML